MWASDNIRVNVEGSPEAVAEFFLRLGGMKSGFNGAVESPNPVEPHKSEPKIEEIDAKDEKHTSPIEDKPVENEEEASDVENKPTNSDEEREHLKSILTERGIEFSPRARLATLKKLVEDSDNTAEESTEEPEPEILENDEVPPVMEDPAATILQKTGQEEYNGGEGVSPEEEGYGDMPSEPLKFEEEPERTYTPAEFLDECKRYCSRVMRTGRDLDTSHRMLAYILQNVTGVTRKVIEVDEKYYNTIVTKLHNHIDLLREDHNSTNE